MIVLLLFLQKQNLVFNITDMYNNNVGKGGVRVLPTLLLYISILLLVMMMERATGGR
jgi:hypothetical protein